MTNHFVAPRMDFRAKTRSGEQASAAGARWLPLPQPHRTPEVLFPQGGGGVAGFRK